MAKSRPDPELVLDDLIALAAEKRVTGETWQAIADAVKKGLSTVRRWPKQYAERWKSHYARAEALLLKEAMSESLLTLRQLLRSESESVRQNAAQKLMQIAEAREKPAPSRESGSPIPAIRQLVAYLEGLNDGQFRELFDGEPADAASSLAPQPAETPLRDSPRQAISE